MQRIAFGNFSEVDLGTTPAVGKQKKQFMRSNSMARLWRKPGIRQRGIVSVVIASMCIMSGMQAAQSAPAPSVLFDDWTTGLGTNPLTGGGSVTDNNINPTGLVDRTTTVTGTGTAETGPGASCPAGMTNCIRFESPGGFGSLLLDYHFHSPVNLINAGLLVSGFGSTNDFTVSSSYKNGIPYVETDSYLIQAGSPTTSYVFDFFPFPGQEVQDIRITYSGSNVVGYVCCDTTNVPEPASMGLLTLALLGLGSVIRRKA